MFSNYLMSVYNIQNNTSTSELKQYYKKKLTQKYTEYKKINKKYQKMIGEKDLYEDTIEGAIDHKNYKFLYNFFYTKRILKETKKELNMAKKDLSTYKNNK